MAEQYKDPTQNHNYDPNTTRTDAPVGVSGRKGGATPVALNENFEDTRQWDATARTSTDAGGGVRRWVPLLIAAIMAAILLTLATNSLRPKENYGRGANAPTNAVNPDSEPSLRGARTVGGTGNGQSGSVNGIATGR